MLYFGLAACQAIGQEAHFLQVINCHGTLIPNTKLPLHPNWRNYYKAIAYLITFPRYLHGMKSPLFACLYILISSTQVLSQPLNFTVQWGKEFNASRKSSLDDIVGFDGTGIYAIKSRFRSPMAGGTTYTLEHYNHEFIPTRSFDLKIKEGNNLCELQHVLHLNNKLYVFYSCQDYGLKKNNLFVRAIDKSSLRPKAETLKLGEIDYVGKSRSNHGDFNFRISRDSSKVLVFYNLPHTKDEPEGFGFHVLNDKMESIWQRNVTLPYKEGLFDVESFRVDNSGNVYLLGMIYKEKRKSKRRGQPNYSYEILACRDGGKTLVQYPVVLEDRFLSDMQIEILDDRSLICAGFYSEKGTYSIKGTYFLTIDAATKAIKSKSFKEFGIDFITQGMSEREANRTLRRAERGDQAELYEYDLDKLLVGKDGSAILIGEQYFVEAVSSTMYINGRTTTTTNYHFYYNDIIAVKINPEGQIEWAEKIAKAQHSINDNGFYSSYTLAIVKGKICFIFNDNADNLGYKGIGRPVNFNGRQPVVMIASLSQQGELVRQPLYKNNLDVITRPKVSKQIRNNQVILFGQRKKSQQFARVVFE